VNPTPYSRLPAPDSSILRPVIRFLERFGLLFVSFFEEVGRWFDMLGRTAMWAVRPPFEFREWMRQMVRVGVDSVPVVVLTTMFTGMVMALQTFSGFQRVHATDFVASVVALSMLRELSPVLVGLMVTGRVGSSMAAEIGTMRVTEQLDALESLATEPVQYLFVPRVIAGIVMLPLLTILGNALGILGGWLVAVQLLGANPVVYQQRTFQFLELNDLMSGLIKAAVFGLILTLTGCVRGYYTRGGAEGVGRATTSAVVTASLTILLSDFFLTKMLF
jgi:phospholipid/cholesterol/gamma-HCH transport system permease protein